MWHGHGNTYTAWAVNVRATRVEQNKEFNSLDCRLVWHRSHGLGSVVFCRDGAGITGEGGDAAEVDTLCNVLSSVSHRGSNRKQARTAGLLCLDVSIVVSLHPVQEFLSARRVSDVLDTEVHPLLDVSVSNDLVNDDSDRRRGNVVDDTRSPDRQL